MGLRPETQLEKLEREVHLLEEVIQRLTCENINLRNDVARLVNELALVKKETNDS